MTTNENRRPAGGADHENASTRDQSSIPAPAPHHGIATFSPSALGANWAEWLLATAQRRANELGSVVWSAGMVAGAEPPQALLCHSGCCLDRAGAAIFPAAIEGLAPDLATIAAAILVRGDCRIEAYSRRVARLSRCPLGCGGELEIEISTRDYRVCLYCSQCCDGRDILRELDIHNVAVRA